jgi:putative sterol carrier protein
MQGIELRESSFEDDAVRLINRIDQLLLEAQANREKKPKRSGLPIKDYFEITLPTMLKWKNPLDVKQAAKQVGTVQFDVVGDEDGGTWTINLEGSAPQVTSGPADNPDLVLKISESTMLDIIAGQFDVESAVAKKEIEIYGDLKLLMTLGILFQGPTHKGPHPPRTGLSIRDYFEVILPTMLKWKSSLAVELAAEEGGKFQFNVLGEEESGTWTIDLEGPSPQVIKGPTDSPDLTMSISERAMYEILAGSFNTKEAIANGEVEISGDRKLLKNLSVLF